MVHKLHLIVAGSRDYDNATEFEKVFDEVLSFMGYDGDLVLLEGGARGADTLARDLAKERGYETMTFVANWQAYGKAAGYLRNREMHEYLQDEPLRACLCFWDGSSKGTQQNFKLAKERGTSLYVYAYPLGKFMHAE